MILAITLCSADRNSFWLLWQYERSGPQKANTVTGQLELLVSAIIYFNELAALNVSNKIKVKKHCAFSENIISFF